MADIMKLGVGLDPGPMREGARQVEAELAKVERAAVKTAAAVDDVSDAGSLNPRSGGRGGMGAAVTGAREAALGMERFADRAKRAKDDVGLFGNAAETAGSKLNTLLKASVGFAAFDLGAKVLGFGSAMDVLNKATDAVAASIRDLIGLTEIQQQLEKERAAAESAAKAWDTLREARDAAAAAARGPGFAQSVSLDIRTGGGYRGAGALGADLSRELPFVSTEGLSSFQQSQVADRLQQVQATALEIQRQSIQELNDIRWRSVRTYSRLSDYAADGGPNPEADAVTARAQADLQAAIDGVEEFAESLRQANAALENERRFNDYIAGLQAEIAQNSAKAVDETAAWMREAEKLAQGFRTIAVGTGAPANTPPFLAGTSNAGSAEYLAAVGGGQLSNFNTPGYRSPDASSFRQQRLNEAERADDELRRLQEEGRRAQQVYRDLGEIGSRAFESFLVGARSASDAVKALGADIFLYLVQGLVTRPIGNALASSLQGAFPALGANFAQHGSTIYQPSLLVPFGGGRPTVVAEAGPERIVPAHARSGGRSNGGGRGVTIVVQPREGDNSWRRSMRQVIHDVKRGGL